MNEYRSAKGNTKKPPQDPPKSERTEKPQEVFRPKSPPSERSNQTHANKNGTFQSYPTSTPNHNGYHGNHNGAFEEIDMSESTANKNTDASHHSENNSSTIINVRDDVKGENEQNNNILESTNIIESNSSNGDLNHTVTSIKHVELNENNSSGLGSGNDINGSGDIRKRESAECFGSHQPPFVSS